MISSPPTVQSQLGEAISIIADSDFWRRWDTLTQVRKFLPKVAEDSRADQDPCRSS